jgi:ribosomal protein L21E
MFNMKRNIRLSRPLENNRAIPLTTYTQTYKKGDITAIKGLSTVQKEMSTNGTMAKLEVYRVTQHLSALLKTSEGKKD